jgi:hypothetical protein
MKNLLLTVLAFGLLSSSAFAQEGLDKKQFTRVVASGKNQRIGFFTHLNPDCSATGNVEIRVTKQPESLRLQLQSISPSTQKNTSASSAMTIRFVESKSVISRRRNTSAMMRLSYLFSGPADLLGKFSTI